MIDQHSAISARQSVLTDTMSKPGDKVLKPETGSRASDVDKHKEEFKKVAREMESLFAYQLLKIMRESTGNLSDDKKENGYDTYMSMFDMEVSKLFADRGLGLQDAIINWLERSPGINNKDFSNKE